VILELWIFLGFKKEWLNANKIFMLEVLEEKALRGSCGLLWGFASRTKGRMGIGERRGTVCE
jgi:hypothetical protein